MQRAEVRHRRRFIDSTRVGLAACERVVFGPPQPKGAPVEISRSAVLLLFQTRLMLPIKRRPMVAVVYWFAALACFKIGALKCSTTLSTRSAS